MKINSNIQAQITNNILRRNEGALSASSEKLSSGYRINSARDNPAGIAITNKMNAQIRSLSKATQNSKNASNVIATAEGALSEIQNMIQRMSELAVKGANDTNTDEDRAAIEKEIQALKEEVVRVAQETEYNTQSLLNGEQALRGYAYFNQPADNGKLHVENHNAAFPAGEYNIGISQDGSGVVTLTGFPTGYNVITEGEMVTVKTDQGGELKLSFRAGDIPIAPAELQARLDLKDTGGMSIQVGFSEGQEIQLVIPEISLKNLGIEDLHMDTIDGCRQAMDQLEEALRFVSATRSELGAVQNRLEATISNLDISIENLTNSYSTIKDTDMAEEMVEYTKLQVLVQAGTTMLTQANEQPQQALQLLQ